MKDISERTVDTIRYFRENITPTPVSIQDDLKSYENSVLFNYVAAENDLRQEEMSKLFTHPDEMNTWLQTYRLVIADDSQKLRIPDTWHGMHPQERLGYEVSRFKVTSGQFGIDYRSNGRHCAVVGLTEDDKHTYPSGIKIPFKRITKEVTANVPITDMGYTEPLMRDGELISATFYIRRLTTDFLLALFDNAKEELGPYSTVDLTRFIDGIILAHELCETDLFKHEPEAITHNDDRAAFELYVESKAKRFLQKQKVPKEAYELFHILRANATEPKNISRLIVDSGFQPLRANLMPLDSQ